MTLYFFAFLSGLVTIFAPCIWPLLPIILSSGVRGGQRKPLGIVTGIAVSFLFATLALAYVLRIFPIDPEIFRTLGVVIIIALGITLLIPKCTLWLEGKVSKFSSMFGVARSEGDGFLGGFVTGGALGLVWSPCAGPILATVATVAATQGVNITIFLTAFFFVLGVSVPLFGIAFLGQKAFSKMRRANQYTARIQQIFGAVIIFMGVIIYTGYDKTLQAKFLAVCGSAGTWITSFEQSDVVTGELQELRGKKQEQSKNSGNTYLQSLGKAPELRDITGWLNTENGQSLSLEALRGKVVLIDFWTYSCINCIRTLPYVQSWYKKYEKEGFVVIGIHTPEFLFEHKKENVTEAIKRYQLTYPVAQDNDYATWTAFENRYWPAHYLIDKEGNIRYTHFGEGEYEKTEGAIRSLLEENGGTLTESDGKSVEAEESGDGNQTSETYLGADRLSRLYTVETPIRGKQLFTYQEPLPLHGWSLGGAWILESERALTSKESRLKLHFLGKKVFLVAGSDNSNASADILIDGKPIEESQSGRDVRNGQLQINEERLYELFQAIHGEQHILEINFKGEGTSVYAFTFS